MSGRQFDPDDDELRAGEYALGFGDPDGRRAVEREMDGNARLARAVRAWERWVEPLWAGFQPVNPPPALWTRIEHATTGAVPRGDAAALIASTGRFPRGRDRWVAGALGFALAACIAGAVFLLQAQPRFPSLVTTLVPKRAGGPVLVGERAGDGSVVFRAVGAVAAPSGKDLELWSLPAGATRPVALAVLRSGEAVVRSGTVPRTGAILLSLEPRGGSPTGLPTGPVLSGGDLSTPE